MNSFTKRLFKSRLVTKSPPQKKFKKTFMGESSNSLDNSEERRCAGGDQFSYVSDTWLADDELSLYTNRVQRQREVEFGGKCKRCNTDLGMRANYCRQCYDTRSSWMPMKPTRRKPNTRPPGQMSSEGHDSFPRLWAALTRRMAPQSESSDSDFNHRLYLHLEREKRREYVARKLRELNEWESTTTEDSLDEELCTSCKAAPQEAVLVHGKSAHLCVCIRCAERIRESEGACPSCGKKVEKVIAGPKSKAYIQSHIFSDK